MFLPTVSSESREAPAYVCSTCHVSILDKDESLDHFEDHPDHYILVLRPQIADHVYINRVEQNSPWMRQHHGIVVKYNEQIRICHFAPCDTNKASITISSVIGFTGGLDLFLHPVRATRNDPSGFAVACTNKTGFDSKSFNCEHFVNLCLLGERRSDMNTKAFWIAGGVLGTAFSVVGGVVGTGLWMAGKSVYACKLVVDHFNSKPNSSPMHHCGICSSNIDVSTNPNCDHEVCLDCGLRIGYNRVCPISNCFEKFFRFTVNIN